MRLKLIACEILFREICWAAAQAKYPVDLEFLPQTYHDDPALGREHLQARLDGVGRVDAVLVGYGLCHGLLVGLRASYLPLVLPRAWDCPSLCLGSNRRRQELLHSHPQAHFFTAGWLEHRGSGCNPGIEGRDREESSTGTPRIWIDLPFAERLDHQQRVQQLVAEWGGTCETVWGDLGWIQRGLDGEWNEAEFLIVRPGERVYATGDDRIITAR